MTLAIADPKPRPRIVDREASKRKLLRDPWCRSCRRRATNCHHLLGKGGRSGDDVEDNLIPLCGSGAHGCHGALHGNPYEAAGRRWTALDVRLAIGLTLRPSEYAHVVLTLSAVPAASFLERIYYVELETLHPFKMRPVEAEAGL